MKPFGRRAPRLPPTPSDEQQPMRFGVGDELVGYRLLRVLGSGARATVFLGHPLRGGDDSARSSTVLKVFNPRTSPDSIQNELAALSQADDTHVVPLRDVGSAPDGLPLLVLERLSGGLLSHFLARRGGLLEAGEAVTLLAPLGETIARLHSRGLCHGQLSTRSVMFRASGAPMLMGFGAAQFLGDPGERGSDAWRAATAEDTAAYVQLADTVLSATSSPGRGVQELREWLAICDPREEVPGFTEVVAERIFAIAPARPLRLAFPTADPPSSVPHRLAPIGSERAASLSESSLETPGGERSLWRRGMHMPSFLGNSLEEALDSAPFRALGLRVKKQLSRVRRPVWLAGGAVAVTVLVLGAVLPGTESSTADQASIVDEMTAEPTLALSDTEEAVTGDDPVAAAVVLLKASTRCVEDLSMLCLDSVFQQGSSALADARELLRSVQEGGELGSMSVMGGQYADPARITVVERLGNSALLNLGSTPETQPASLLLMKGEAGWRIREILAD